MKKLTVLGEELKVKLSPSFIANAACPFYLKCNYVDHIQERYIRIASLRGKACHESIYTLLRGCLKEEIQPSELPDTLIRKTVEKNIPHEILSETAQILSWVMKWCERFKLPSHVVGIEEKIGLDDEYDECQFKEASYRGIIDLLQIKNSHAVITDWKSQPHIMPETELNEHEQLTFYCWLVWKLYPDVERFTARIWYLRYGFYADTVRTERDLEEFEYSLVIKERKIAEISNWDPIPGKHCQYCDYILRCPIALDLSPENPEIITQSQAVIAAQKITVIETLLKQLKEGLKTYVKENDDVRIGDDWIYGYKHSVSDQWNADKLADILLEHGVSIGEVVNPDVRKIKKLLKEASKNNPALEAALEASREEKHNTVFKGYQKK